MTGRTVSDAGEFLHRVAMLLQDEARVNLIIGIARTIQRSPEVYPDYDLFIVTRSEAPVAAALVTHPHNLILADAVDIDAVGSLTDLLLEGGVVIPGVVGNRPTVDGFAERWRERTGVTVRLEMDQGVFSLESVVAGDPPRGSARMTMRSRTSISSSNG